MKKHLIICSKEGKVFLFLTLILISIVSLFNFTKKELMPKEDRGVFFGLGHLKALV